MLHIGTFLQRYVFFLYLQRIYLVMRYRIRIFSLLAVSIMALAPSCTKDSIHGDGFVHKSDNPRDGSGRVETPEKRNVMLLYSAGFNSISSYLREDIQDLYKGWLPEKGGNENVLLVYSHLPASGGGYNKPNAPTLTRLWKDLSGNVRTDTLMVYPDDTRSATPSQLNAVLEYVRDEFPANTYGMVFSSHATGYLPAGYYSKPDNYTFTESRNASYRIGIHADARPVPYHEIEHDPSLPAVKSIGQDQVGSPGGYVSYEIELDDFARAIPMKLDYILFDACLMGGVEVAYELKDVCRYVGFSQTEVLAEGFDYTMMVSHLLGTDTPDPQSICSDFFEQYDVRSGVYRSATISMVDCSKMESLAETCSGLFEKYRSSLAALDPDSVQRYFRSRYHWFYDLKDIIAKAGATQEELDRLDAALNECIIYKAATPEFMCEFKISTYSGFSMYLPCNGSTELSKYYRTLQWNKATGLVE